VYFLRDARRIIYLETMQAHGLWPASLLERSARMVPAHGRFPATFFLPVQVGKPNREVIAPNGVPQETADNQRESTRVEPHVRLWSISVHRP